MPRCLLFFTAFLSLAAAPPRPTPGEDREAILGKWRLASYALGEDETKDPADVWTITKTHIVYTSGRKDAYALDTKKSPRQIDVTTTADDEEVKLVGIYQLKGDELTICITESKYARPKRFGKGKDHNTMTLKRVKDKDR